ncbi:MULTISPECIES: NAD(P)-dependent oxidoreductase [Asaia]|uniref:Pyridine nucleotide-disulphide oxidoreductase associated with reductive pyrimidine catabolism n=1 Tax=Asaia bogorensis TaxID=91915 RepID=A0A060QLP4_9PROT|nr:MULTISPECIES: NAD(P)-dependent oxidoreductase [Asaia]ETC99043.1 dihydropyrimidine dehydrogenase subunit A [Asaia sp. SF2.1]CDG40512.1 Pyridine nucleotide-disulphide oxidoreductase associated with reductive pyrimidine catabolism [Asaia bogorensis]
MRPDIACGRLPQDILARNFADAHPGLTPEQAALEADRCFYCYDAPCIEACPTDIDIPRFIKAIASRNTAGAARTILQSNILGGSCARVCPTEILCEQKCVHTAIETHKPVRIGALQRYATDWQMAQDTHPFTRATPTGRHIAIVGAGPAGLACAHRLAMHGHEVTLFDRHEKAGGLNEYGVAAYKLADDFAQKEIDFLMAIGGIHYQGRAILGETIHLATLRQDYDAVFLAIGLSGVRALGLPGETMPGVKDAVAFIEHLRSHPLASVQVGRRVVVIGGGNTAIDAAVQAKRLGAEEVTLVYRRGEPTMSATDVERDWAQTNGVTLRLWAAPTRLEFDNGALTGVTFRRTDAAAKASTGPATPPVDFTIAADMVLKAIGQVFVPDPVLQDQILIENGRLVVDEKGRTTLAGVYAGGDCTAGEDLTVAAVRDGREAAQAIHSDLTPDDLSLSGTGAL